MKSINDFDVEQTNEIETIPPDIKNQAANLTEALGSFQKAIRALIPPSDIIIGVVKSIAQMMESFSDLFNETIVGLAEALKKIYLPEISEERKQELLDNYVAWGKYGWTCLPDMPWYLFCEHPKSIGEANVSVRKYHSSEAMEEIFSELRMHKIKKEDLESAILCYRYKQYKACALLLFGIIDSKLIRKQQKGDGRRKSGEGAVRKIQKAFEKCKDEESFYTMLKYVNLFACLSTFFANGNDFKKEPITINRNFIDHGMNSRSVRKRDCIQLFLLLKNLMDFMENKGSNLKII